jgi:hypothetical protein
VVNRLARVADNARQIATRLGARPTRCFLVHTRSRGSERGEGLEVEVKRIELLPTPKVETLDSVTFSVFHAGTVPAGSVKLTEVSLRYTYDELVGLMVPERHEDQIPEPYWFFYELVEDGRGDPYPQRNRFRVLSYPWRDAENAQWKVMLERTSEDRTRSGHSAYLEGKE